MSNNEGTIRAFVAIYPSPEVVEQLGQLTEKLRIALGNDGIRWAKPEQFHLTTQFLGSIPRIQVTSFADAIAQTVDHHSSMHLRAETLGCFPNVQRARVLWIGLSGDLDKLQRLKSDLDHALTPLGYQPESRPFHPHITLARIAELNGRTRAALKQTVNESQTISACEFRVGKIDLMQSHLSPKGATYESLASFSLVP